jgi:DNA (cytosine-5)-methyltransferase 1
MDSNDTFNFIDLFAGIGGIRIALSEAGGTCVMTSEVDKFARQTYRTYFRDGDSHRFNHDINDAEPDDVPDHDLLAGGFPCQSFSIAGVSKKNSLDREHGFEDPTTGTLFFNIKEILKAKQPDAFLLENVKNLHSHDQGRTWKVIAYALDQAGYAFTHQILDAARVVPQHRERIFIAGFRREAFGLENRRRNWSHFWEEVDERIECQAEEQRRQYGVDAEEEWPRVGPVLEPHNQVPDTYTLTENLWEYLQDYKAKHRAKGNGFGYGMVRPDDTYTRTISARYYKDGSEALVYQGEDKRPRRLTPLECARLQGYPEDFRAIFDRSVETPEQPVSDTQAYKQFGNSVCVPIVEAITQTQAEFMQDSSKISSLPDSEEPVQKPLFDFEDDQLSAMLTEYNV